MSAYQNATFAFGAYCLSDLCLLSAAVLSEDARVVGDGARSGAPAAAALIAAALLKSSQFPLCSLLPRSMEGPTPASALGYGGLSPHLGVVLLASMEAEWSVYAWARAVVGAVGALTAVMATLIAQTRADRKGALAYAISASVGQIYIVLALGYVDIALVVSFGHAAYRMKQILLAPDVLASFTESRAQLDGSPDADGWGLLSPPSWLYSVSRSRASFAFQWPPRAHGRGGT
jgi:NADH:ubiquinone oxidoreductase subunit 5 (subunit L)/multisubunit Na+/H+ antiporter MnhA subunit